MKQLAKYENHVYALMRIVAGFMFSFHGMQKILGLLSDFHPAIGSQLWFGGVIELVGGLAILLGFRTRWAAFICSGEMAVAYVQFHWRFQMGPEIFPGVNKGELALLYSIVFLLIACRGGVKWSMDKTG
jgi:putative oxidoreductase